MDASRASSRPARAVRPAAVIFTLAVAAAIVASLFRVAKGRTPWAEKGVLAPDFREPSGVVFHPARKTLFVVGDEGHVGEVATDGKVIRVTNFGGADFEGLTVDPSSGLLYAAVEGRNEIVEIDPLRLQLLRTFSLDERGKGKPLFPYGADGLEGIAFVPDEANPEGGTFFVVNRAPGAKNRRPERGRSFIAELSVPIRTTSAKRAKARIIRAMACEIGDLAGIEWIAERRVLAAVSDHLDRYVEIDLNGTVRRTMRLPGRSQEGIAFDDRGSVYIAQDSGGIIRLVLRRNHTVGLLP